MYIPLDQMPAGARELCEQADIAAVVEKYCDFNGSGIGALASDLTKYIFEIVPEYEWGKPTTLQALTNGRAHCGHRATALEAITTQLPNVVSALLVYPRHVANIIGSTVTNEVALIDTGFKEPSDPASIHFGNFVVHESIVSKDVEPKEEVDIAGQLLIGLITSTEETAAYVIQKRDLVEYYGVLLKNQHRKGKKVVLRTGLSALRYIAANYT